MPWRYPLGSVVWCKMQGYPFWPAEVMPPVVNDQDIARQRVAEKVFVRFFGWSDSAAYHYATSDEVMTWDVGVDRGLLGVKQKKVSLIKLFRQAKEQVCLSAVAS